jgi:hypothetical protein
MESTGGKEKVPTQHVITVEMPFEVLLRDQLTETTNGKEEDEEVKGATGDGEGTSEESNSAEELKDDKKAQSTPPKGTSEKPTSSTDELDLPPAGSLMGPNDLPMAVAADGRPVGFMSMGPLAPVAGWRIVDINGHQPVTSSDFDFVSSMLSRRSTLFPDSLSSDEGDESEEEKRPER